MYTVSGCLLSYFTLNKMAITKSFKNSIVEMTEGNIIIYYRRLKPAALIQRMNESIDPCDDFYEFACGTFVHDTVISDEEAGITPLTAISNEQKYKLTDHLSRGNFEGKRFTSNNIDKKSLQFLFRFSINEKGLEPLRDIIDKDFGGWPVLLGSSWNEGNFSWIEAMHKSRSVGLPINTIFDLNVYPNLINSTQRMLWLDRPPFPIPREYLVLGLNDSVVQAYLRFSIDVATLMGADPSQAEEEMKEVLQFQMELAEITLNQEARREVENMLNIKTIQEIKNLVPEIPWLDYINRMLPGNLTVKETEEINIGDFGYITNFTKILRKTSKRVIANYIIWKIIADSAPYLSEDIRELEFELTKVLSGLSSRPSRWEECVNLVSQSLVHATGNLYIKNYFDEDSKEQIDDLVFYLREAFDEILRNIDWMDSKTKKRALIKSKAMKPFVAYPEELVNDAIVSEFYSGLKIEEKTQLIHNMLNLSKFDSDYTASLLRERVNSSHWTERPPPAVVNAFYSFIQNTLEFPAGILQGHFFQPDRPKYMNYGTIGFVIGHEITHGFDDQGRNFDEEGNLRNWWQNSTEQNFLQRAKCIIEQYNNFADQETGLNLNGVNTQGENIADNGGIKASYRAYRRWVRRHGMENRLPGMDYTPNQLFWISGAQVSSWILYESYTKM
ncbi:Endothelin-converting enzyme 2 [Armadillidium vulgare]|nr:Endothelin-converting enzyme 2 [Armadillidium vulgare]